MVPADKLVSSISPATTYLAFLADSELVNQYIILPLMPIQSFGTLEDIRMCLDLYLKYLCYHLHI